MVKESRPQFIGISSTVEPEKGRNDGGNIEIIISIQHYPVTDEELLEIKKIQKETADKIDMLLKK